MESPNNLTIDQHNERLSAENARYGVLYIEFEMFVRGVVALEDWKEAIQKVFEYVHRINYISVRGHANIPDGKGANLTALTSLSWRKLTMMFNRILSQLPRPGL